MFYNFKYSGEQTSAKWRQQHNKYIFHCSETYRQRVEYKLISQLNKKETGTLLMKYGKLFIIRT